MKKILISLSFVIIGFSAKSQIIPKWKITDVEKYMAAKNDEVLVINFWATFCKPCVAEIPSFISITNKYKSDHVKLLLVSLDLPAAYPKKMAAFVNKQKWKANFAWLQETDANYFCPKIDSSWSGSIPSTLIVNTKTGYRKFFEGEMTAAEFEKMLKEVIAGKADAAVIKERIPAEKAIQ